MTSRAPLHRLQPRSGWAAINLRELWEYRELLLFQALRDIKIRYKQTVLGIAWAVIQPLMMMVVYTIFFGRLAKVPQNGPYAITTFCALLPWQLFASTLTQSSNSLVDNAHLLTKVYFPRLIVPMSAMLGALVDFAIAFVILIGMMVWQGIAPGWAILTLPIFLLLAMASAIGVGLWLSTLNVKYRDVRYTIPFLVQIWMILSPVVYSSDLVKPPWRTLYALNPMVGVVNGFKWALLGTAPPPGAMLLISSAATIVVLIGGLFFFRRGEKSFADVV